MTHDDEKIAQRGVVFRPSRVDAAPDRLTWRSATVAGWPADPGSVLRQFASLASADPEDMAMFMTSQAVPELCEHGLPLFHRLVHHVDGPWPAPCPIATASPDGKGEALDVTQLRRAARAVAAALELAPQLRRHKTGRPEDWDALEAFHDGPWRSERDDEDWRLARDRFAEWLDYVLQASGVGNEVRWLTKKGLHTRPAVRGLFGLLALLLYRAAVGREAYVCSVCGTEVDRTRPPRAGEQVYCSAVDCQRERQRRNQARRRANDREGRR